VRSEGDERRQGRITAVGGDTQGAKILPREGQGRHRLSQRACLPEDTLAVESLAHCSLTNIRALVVPCVVGGHPHV
jgi:hypothetical protein